MDTLDSTRIGIRNQAQDTRISEVLVGFPRGHTQYLGQPWSHRGGYICSEHHGSFTRTRQVETNVATRLTPPMVHAHYNSVGERNHYNNKQLQKKEGLDEKIIKKYIGNVSCNSSVKRSPSIAIQLQRRFSWELQVQINTSTIQMDACAEKTSLTGRKGGASSQGEYESTETAT